MWYLRWHHYPDPETEPQAFHLFTITSVPAVSTKQYKSECFARVLLFHILPWLLKGNEAPEKEDLRTSMLVVQGTYVNQGDALPIVAGSCRYFVGETESKLHAETWKTEQIPRDGGSPHCRSTSRMDGGCLPAMLLGRAATIPGRHDPRE